MQKICSKSIKLVMISSFALAKNIVSSVNYKCDTFTLSLPIEKPVNKCLSFALSNNLGKPSATRVNKKGDKVSPCLNPLVPLNLPLGYPLSIIEKEAEERQPFIYVLYLTPKPFFSKKKSRNPHSIISNVFSKSILKTTPLFPSYSIIFNKFICNKSYF